MMLLNKEHLQPFEAKESLVGLFIIETFKAHQKSG